MLEQCSICPNNCKINRNIQHGKCKASEKIKIGLYSTHMYEEPCISGKNGSRNSIFFTLQFIMYILPKL